MQETGPEKLAELHGNDIEMGHGTARAKRRRVIQLVLEVVSDEEHKRDVLACLRAVMRPLLAVGDAVRARILVDADDTKRLFYVEEWQNASEFYAEARSERLRRLLVVMESAANEPSLEFRTIHQTRGLDLVEELRGESADESPREQT